MNLITIQPQIDAVNRAKEEAAYSWINLGKRLVELKEVCLHGTFTQVAEDQCGLKKNQCASLMKIYREFGQKSFAEDFSIKALLELSRSPDPQAALDEANERKEQGESITSKQAKQIADLQKQAEKLKSEIKNKQPDISNLIPELSRMHNSGSLPKATALEFSKLDHAIQRDVVLPKFKQVRDQQQTIISLEKEKAHALERESKAREERESLQADYDAAVEQGAQAVILEKEKEIKRKEKELEQLQVDMREDIEKSMGRMIEKRVRSEAMAELEAERKAKEKAEREAQKHKDRAEKLADDNLTERARAESAEAELQAALPVEKDAQHARSLSFVISDLKTVLEKIDNDCEPHQRQQSEEKVRELIGVVNTYLDSAPQIIDMV